MKEFAERYRTPKDVIGSVRSEEVPAYYLIVYPFLVIYAVWLWALALLNNAILRKGKAVYRRIIWDEPYSISLRLLYDVLCLCGYLVFAIYFLTGGNLPVWDRWRIRDDS